MKNFINDFKIYCENVEDTKGLEFIRENIIYSFYNLETIIDDHCELDFDNIESQIIEGEKLVKILPLIVSVAKDIYSLNVRDIWKAFNNNYIMNNCNVKSIIENSLVQSYEYLYHKKVDNKDFGLCYKRELKEEELEQWYIDLFNLEEKYF